MGSEYVSGGIVWLCKLDPSQKNDTSWCHVFLGGYSLQVLEVGEKGWWSWWKWHETCLVRYACQGSQLDMPGKLMFIKCKGMPHPTHHLMQVLIIIIQNKCLNGNYPTWTTLVLQNHFNIASLCISIYIINLLRQILSFRLYGVVDGKMEVHVPLVKK